MLIKDMRIKAGMTQQEFADFFEIPIDVVKSWESERRSPTKWAEKLIIEKLSNANNEGNIEITLKSEIVNVKFQKLFHFGDVVTVPILGYVKSNPGSYDLVFFNPKKEENYFPVCNGLSKTGQKYGIFAKYDGSSPAAFISEYAYIDK